MRVIPGTHDNGFSEYVPADLEKISGAARSTRPRSRRASRSTSVSSPTSAGCSKRVFIHGAKANTSDTRRAGYAMRYFPTTSLVYSKMLVDKPNCPALKLYLARGEDIAGNRFENA